MVVFARLRGDGDGGGRRLGVTASRKVGNAVTRARCKRRLRELFRTDTWSFPDADVDVVINARHSAAVAPWDELQRDYARCVEKLTERLTAGG